MYSKHTFPKSFSDMGNGVEENPPKEKGVEKGGWDVAGKEKGGRAGKEED